LRFSDSYTPSEFLAFRQRLTAACKRLRWDQTDLNNFALQTIGNDVQNDMDKPDWEYLLAQIGDLPTPPPLNVAPAAPQCATPDAALLAFVQMATAEELRSLYRAMSKRMHPDTGGDAVKMRELNLIWEQLEK
jgi:hypothetical protein